MRSLFANGSPNADARRVWLASAGNVESLWDAAVSYTVAELAPMNPRFRVAPSEFHLEGIAVHPPGSFEGGELVFWFIIEGDKNGTYFVPLHDGKPLDWHRDS